MRRFFLVTMVVLGMVVLPKAAHAAVIAGTIDLTGCIVVTATSADWFRFCSTPTVPNPTGPGLAEIVGTTLTNGGVPIPIPAGSLMNETNLDFTTATPGTTLNVNFFEFPQAATNIDFVLTHVDTCLELGGTYQCFGTSPFGFVQNSSSVTIALQLRGNVYDTSTPGIVSTWSGLWTTNVSGTIADIFAQIEPPNCGLCFIEHSYSVTKIAVAAPAVPEPATLLTFGVGSAILARMRRRKKA
jgi:hypothetical protein